MSRHEQPKKRWWLRILLVALLVVGLLLWWQKTHPNFLHRADPGAKEAAPDTPPQTTDHSTELQQVIDSFVASEPAQYAIYVEDLSSGSTASHQPDEIFRSASMYKPFVAYESLNLVDQGEFSLSQDTDTNRGLDLRGCLDIMITVSDNDCGVILQRDTGALRDRVDWTKYGFTSTDISGVYPETTARDLAHLFKSIHHQSHLSDSSNDLLLGFLKAQEINDRLPAQLPQNITVAHKTGDLEGYVHDGGIVYGPNGPYVIVVLTGPWDDPVIHYDSIASLSKQIYDVLD